jgi:hypothetical protein
MNSCITVLYLTKFRQSSIIIAADFTFQFIKIDRYKKEVKQNPILKDD